MSDDGTELVPAERQDGSKRGVTGQYTRSPRTAERDAQAAELRGRGLGYRRIGEELGMSTSAAYAATKRALRAIVEEPAQELRALELARLDAALERLAGLQVKVEAVLERDHITVNNGRIIYDGDGPLLDTAPILQAVDRLLKIEAARIVVAERRAKLLGLDAPAKLQADVTMIAYEIVGVDLAQL